jgi:hypothetical protein
MKRIELYGYSGDNRICNENEIPENTSTLHLKIPIIKYIVYVLFKIKSSQSTLDRNTPH